MNLAHLQEKFLAHDVDPDAVQEFVEIAMGHLALKPGHQLVIWYGEWKGAENPAPALNADCTGDGEEDCLWWNQVLV